MFATDEDALMCDLAETYHIYDYKSLPLSRVAIFAIGLGNNSRIKLKMSKMKYPFETILLALAVDYLAVSNWMNSKDGTKGVNRPKSILFDLIGEEKESDIESFDTPEEFERRRMEILKKGGR